MQGWCRNNYHKDGKRRYGFLQDGLCKECIKLCPESERGGRKESEEIEENNIGKIQEIIKIINTEQQSASMIARKGLCEIDDLGGYYILGYDTDREYLKNEFPQLYTGQLSRQRSCGRIEKILGVPIGTYSYNKLIPLMQFRIMVPCGRKSKRNLKGQFEKLETTTTQSFKENPEGIAKVKQAYQIAQQLANNSIPSGQFLEKAIEIMAEQGLAKKRSTPYRRSVNNKNKELAQKDKQWLVVVAEKEQEIKKLKARIYELESSLKILGKNELSPELSLRKY